jgi:hypothetical protein
MSPAYDKIQSVGVGISSVSAQPTAEGERRGRHDDDDGGSDDDAATSPPPRRSHLAVIIGYLVLCTSPNFNITIKQ